MDQRLHPGKQFKARFTVRVTAVHESPCDNPGVALPEFNYPGAALDRLDGRHVRLGIDAAALKLTLVIPRNSGRRKR
jgi:hypothetical protein